MNKNKLSLKDTYKNRNKYRQRMFRNKEMFKDMNS